MSGGQVITLILMFFIGLLKLDSFFEGRTKAIRIFGAVWVFTWWSPPLFMLWTKGVFG